MLLRSTLSLSGTITRSCDRFGLLWASIFGAHALWDSSRACQRSPHSGQKSRCCLLVCYRPLASSVDCGQNLCQNNVGVASETVLWKVQYRRSSVSTPALRVGTRKPQLVVSGVSIGLHKLFQRGAQRRRRGDKKTPSTRRQTAVDA